MTGPLDSPASAALVRIPQRGLQRGCCMPIRIGDSAHADGDAGRIRRVVVGVKLTNASHEALAIAADLARRVGADLSILYVAPDPCTQPLAKAVDVEPGDLADRWVGEAEARLRHLETGLEPARVTTAVRLGSAADEILRFARESEADVVVLGRNEASEPSHRRMGPVVSRVLDAAGCPVITAPALKGERRVIPSPPVRPSRESGIHGILVATDLSALSRAAVAFGRRLAGQMHCPLHVLNVVESPWTRSAACAIPAPETIETLRRAARTFHQRELLESLTDGTGDGLRPLVRVGDPATEIIRCATQLGDDLIVLGTRGRGAVGRRFLGSVARDVVTRAPCPTATIGPLSARQARSRTSLRPQYEIAARMAAAHAAFPFDLVLIPGDNFYGRQGPEDLKQKFVEVTDAELRFRAISRGGATVDAGVIRRRTRRGASAATSEGSGARAGAATLIGTSRGVR
jgi:nucleotide-binding universal stress UspA family protein